MRKKILFVITFLLVIKNIYCQPAAFDTTNKLYQFFKNNFDTTIVFYANVPREIVPNYYFIATYQSQVFLSANSFLPHCIIFLIVKNRSK